MTFAPYTAVRGCGNDGPGAANMLYWLDRESPWRDVGFNLGVCACLSGETKVLTPAGDVYAISTGSPVIAVVDPSVPSASVHGTTPAGTTSTLITASTGVIYAMPGGSNNATRIEAGVVTQVTGTGAVGSTRNPAFQVGSAVYAVTSTNSGLNTILKITDIIPPSPVGGIYRDGRVHLS